MLGSSLLMWTGTVTPWAGLVVALPILAAVVVAIVVLTRNNRERDGGVPRRFGLIDEIRGFVHPVVLGQAE